MKKILLASTALVGFAGVAAADVSFSGSAELQFKGGGDSIDFTGVVTEDGAQEGLDWDGELDVAFTQDLDNGLSASASFGTEYADGGTGQGQDLEAKDFLLTLESDAASLNFGNTEFAAVNAWSGVGDMEADGFSEEDGEVVIRGEVSMGGIDAQLSYLFDDTSDDLEQLSLGVSSQLAGVDLVIAYQSAIDDVTIDDPTHDLEAGISIAGGSSYRNADLNPNEITAVSAGMTVSGMDLSIGYATQDDTPLGGETVTSTGLDISYPVNGATSLGAYYVMEDDGVDATDDDDNMGVSVTYDEGPVSLSIAYEDETGTTGIDATVSYDMGNGVSLFAGMAGEQDDDGYYAGGAMDLGSGAEVRLIHVDADNLDADNEYFGDDDPIGTTLSLSFSF